MEYPILYSFRRCPYALRARYALVLKGIQCELREVHLKHKPQALLDASPKATVPVLVLTDGTVIDESMDIIFHALGEVSDNPLITTCDSEFTTCVRKYKYFERYPAQSQADHRASCEAVLLQKVEALLAENNYLTGNEVSIVDIALFPHIRQFSIVDSDWFERAPYPHITRWLESFYTSPAYEVIMQKHAPWQEGDAITHLINP